MDDLTLAMGLTGNTSTETKVEQDSPANASIVYMIAVTSSSNGEVVLRNETEEDGEWADGDFTEVDEDGDFEEVEEETETVDDSILDLTDGDGVDIGATASTAYTVVAYQTEATAAYIAETTTETEGEVEEDDIAGEEDAITDEIDDGNAEALPDVGEDESDELAGEDSDIDEVTDEEYTLTDSTEDDVSDVVEGAEISDGYTVAECIGSIKAGERVAVMVQNGKMVVVGSAGSGDATEAEVQQIVEDLKVINLVAENLASDKADINLANIKEATIGGFDIDSSSLHSNKTAIDDPTAGVFVGTAGIGIGDGNAQEISGSPFEVYADGRVNMRGKNGSIMFNPETGNIDIVATNFSIGTKPVVVSTVVSYQVGTSQTTAPTGTWLESIPTVADGKYLWTKTVTTYSDGNTNTAYSVAKQSGDSIIMTITSSNGNVFKSSNDSTVLTAHVYVNGVEQTITSAGKCSAGTVRWYLGDTLKATSNTLTVTGSQVTDSAVYTVQLE